MNRKTIRQWAFNLHRYLGLAIGLLAVIIGLTGSLLVFYPEMDQFLIQQKIGSIAPQGEKVALNSIVDNLKEVYSQQGLVLESLEIPKQPEQPYQVWLLSPEEKWLEAFVNPYTGEILGERYWEESLFGIIYDLHYRLGAGKIGLVIAGIVAGLLFILSCTGLILWPGWRNLIAGFKIKWKAHFQRVNFDLHKVTGIVVVVFLGAIAFTGFCWNFYEQTEPLIYAATLTPKPPVLESQPLPNQEALRAEDLLAKAQTALPEAETLGLIFPSSPEGVVRVRKRFPQEITSYGRTSVYLDQYSGEILKIDSALEPTRAQAVLNAFGPLHFGTFGGLPTRILYLLVGLAPAILFATGLGMWWYRRPRKQRQSV